MKTYLLASILSVASLAALAQTPIDELQKRNLEYLEAQEAEGYEFRSQIITEFDYANASQDVNIQLDANYTYLLVASGDSNIPGLDIEVKPTKSTEVSSASGAEGEKVDAAYFLKPAKSGRYKISIMVKGLTEDAKGFVSFTLLRK